MNTIKKNKNKSHDAFTLIEMIVVIGVIAMTLPIISMMVFAILNQQLKIYRLSQVKREGDTILSLIETNIRNNATSIYDTSILTTEKCSSKIDSTYQSNANFFFKNVKSGGTWFSYQYDSANNTIILRDHTGSNTSLTSNKVRITIPAGGYFLSCERLEQYATPVVTIRFTVNYNTNSPRFEENASLTYSTKVKLRNY